MHKNITIYRSTGVAGVCPVEGKQGRIEINPKGLHRHVYVQAHTSRQRGMQFNNLARKDKRGNRVRMHGVVGGVYVRCGSG